MVIKFLKASYENVKNALVKTGSLLGNKLRSLFKGPINEDTLEQLEKVLYEADLGVHYAQELTEKVRERLKNDSSLTSENLIDGIRKEIIQRLSNFPNQLAETTPTTPQVFLIVGVNGNGKTTSVAKLAYRYQAEGKKVLVGAADTFRAAAIEQLEIWANSINIDIVKGAPKSDPASVAFDAVTAGKARNVDVIIIDTAGRLHNKLSLMQELEKIRRSCNKVLPSAPHETLLVLDATTGQNALDQAQSFHQHTPLTGLILTKLDGTAKGGAVLAIQRKLNLPIKFIGIGEKIEDLQPFDAEKFVDALFE